VQAYSANLTAWSAIAPSSKQAASSNLTTYAGKAPPSGAVVGTTDTQTLSNKNLSDATELTVGKSNANITGAGGVWLSDGRLLITTNNDWCARINRNNGDGELLKFDRDTIQQGSISVASGVVSYNAFMGSHYAESDDDLPFGTIVEVTGELVTGLFADQKRLSKVKASDKVGSAAVYGVAYGRWGGEDGWHTIAALGASHVRIQAGEGLYLGALIESAGNGCGRVQQDDCIKAGTVGKITSLERVETYDDGSFVVPCVLYCG